MRSNCRSPPCGLLQRFLPYGETPGVSSARWLLIVLAMTIEPSNGSVTCANLRRGNHPPLSAIASLRLLRLRIAVPYNSS